eukprot:scaffold172373_cov31-Tisochrysis_lutea.AAC.1
MRSLSRLVGRIGRHGARTGQDYSRRPSRRLCAAPQCRGPVQPHRWPQGQASIQIGTARASAAGPAVPSIRPAPPLGDRAGPAARR